MEQNISKIKRSIRLYPIFYAFSADLIFFVPIDTLYLNLVKGMDASQISAMTMIGLLVCILAKNTIVKIAKKIGNANSVKVGVLMLFIASIILTFGKSFISLVMYKIIYIEDTALKITKQDEQQKIMINIETYRKLGQLLLSVVFTLILMKYELIVIEFILLGLSAIEIIVNRKMCKKLERINSN